MKNTLAYLTALACLWATSEAAFAVTAPNIPEPGILSLLMAGGIVGAIITIRKRRK